MLKFAFLIGFYSYTVLLLGIFGLLTSLFLFPATIIFGFVLFLFFKNSVKTLFLKKNIFENKSELCLIILIIILALVNLIGALGPELAFDSLWYHLTIPKMYLLSNKVYFIHGNLLYYNLMPKLVEMLYTASLNFGGEIVAKLIHYIFGLLSCWALYKLSRLYLVRMWALIAVVIFYSNLVVAWLSITAYSDLARAFYETLAFFYLLLFMKNNKRMHFLVSALLLGFAVSTKILSIGTIPIFIVIVLMTKKKLFYKIKISLLFLVLSISVPLPWFIFSLINSGNPFYPLFSQLGLRNFSFQLITPIVFLKTFINTFLFSSDPINPIYIICFPFVLMLLFKKLRFYKPLFVYSLISYFVWHMTSQSGGARFLTAYLPVYTLLTVIAIQKVKRQKIIVMLLATIIFISLITILYRGAANKRYIPFIFSLQTKQDFLMKNLNFSFGDFYDENSEIKKIVGKKTVKLVNMHNLYYVDFPFTLEEFDDLKDPSYVLVQNGEIPNMYTNAQFVYKNEKTHVKLYKL